MQLVDGGTARRTIVSIHDAVEAIWLMLRNPRAAQNETFHLGNPNNEVRMSELAELMRSLYAEITGDASYRQHPIVNTSSEEFYGAGYEDCDRRMPDISKAKNLLGWTPQRPLDELMRETMSWYHENYVLNRPLAASQQASLAQKRSA